MLRIATIALALSASIAAPSANAADKIPVVATPSDYGCAVRMMFIGTMARNAAKDQTKPPETRAKVEALQTDTREAFYYYIGRLGPEFAATNRSAEGLVQFNAMKSTPKEQLTAEIAACLTKAKTAEKALLTAMKSPKAS